ncbi:MAG: hypothetical protein ACOZBW_08295 [Thermodesulfobacteriota bacterium]
MKKITVLAVAACLAIALVAPAMAVTVDFSGYYRVRGFMNTNITLNDQTPESEAYYDNRFRLQSVFKANDAVSVTTRFDALDDDVWGDTNNVAGDINESAIDWDRVYMTLMTDVGMFMIGHQQAGVWGLDFFDDDYNDDRIKYTGKTGDIIFGGIIQKTEETDALVGGQADGDLDVYYLFGIFKQEGLEAGLLAAYARGATISALTLTKEAFLPYFKFTAGPFSARGELIYEMGEVDFDNPLAQDSDIEALCYGIEGAFNMDMAKLYAGWISVSGQDEGEFNKGMMGGGGDWTQGNTTYDGLGDDFNPLAILTDDLGDKILNSGGGVVFGVDLLYAGADVKVNDKLTVSGIIGYAMANEEWAGMDDEYGTEIDVTAKYQIMDNVEYKATLAYLMTGDLLGQMVGAKTVTADHTDDNFGIMHQIQVNF